MNADSQTGRAEALVALIARETEAEAARLRGAAEADAKKVVAAAHHKARARMHRAIEAFRRAREIALRDETARLDTSRRQRRQREAGAAIEAGLPALERAFADLWADAGARRDWMDRAIAEGAERLGAGAWVVDVPEGFDEDERGVLASAVREASGQVPEVVGADLTAGLRLRLGTACLDASAAALMRDRAATGAAILAELGFETEDAR